MITENPGEFRRRSYGQIRRGMLRIRWQMEMAEACIGAIDPLVADVFDLGLSPRTALIGPKIESRPYPAEAGITESDLVVFAALLIPGGFGVVQVDSEVLASMEADQELEATAWHYFTPFTKCLPVHRAMLLDHVNPLADRFLRLLD